MGSVSAHLGWRSLWQAEITNGIKGCAHLPRLQDSRGALVGTWGTEDDCTPNVLRAIASTLGAASRVPDLRRYQSPLPPLGHWERFCGF